MFPIIVSLLNMNKGGREVIQITYQKNNGDIIQKYSTVTTSHKIGQTTCWGWNVLDIKYKYKDKYYSSYEYDRLRLQDEKKRMNINKIKCVFNKTIREFGYSLIIFLFYMLLQYIIG